MQFLHARNWLQPLPGLGVHGRKYAGSIVAGLRKVFRENRSTFRKHAGEKALDGKPDPDSCASGCGEFKRFRRNRVSQTLPCSNPSHACD